MLRRVSGVVLALVMGLPLQAGPVDEIRAHVLSGDYEAAETLMRDLHKAALESRDFGALRSINASVFMTTDIEVIDFLESWTEAEPGSPYAQAGWFWNRLHVGFLRRGEKDAGQTPKLAMQAFQGEMLVARRAAMAAFAAAPDYLPASDAMLEAATSARAEVDVEAVLATAMAQAPNIDSLEKGIRAVSPEWGGSVAAMADLCIRYSGTLEGYDEELCFIRAALAHGVPPGMRQVAQAMLWERDDALLDYYRLSQFSIPNAAAFWGGDVLLEKHRAGLDIGVDYETYLWGAEWVARAIENPLYINEARAQVDAAVEAHLAADPRNPEVIGERIKTLGRRDGSTAWDREKLAEARALWQDGLHFGLYRPDYWITGGMLASAEAEDPKAGAPYYTNAVALDPYPVGHLGRLMDVHDSAWFWAQRAIAGKGRPPSDPGYDPHAVQREAACPALRAARLVEAYCALGRGDQECEPHFGTLEQARKVLANAPLVEMCPQMMREDPGALLYEFAPFVGAEKSDG